MPTNVKLMVPFREGLIVVTDNDEFWFGCPAYNFWQWTWRRI